MRADRLVAIVLLLQAQGQVTAAQLAELLETSERTIRRDLDALSMAGVPVYAQRGRGGGWALLGGHRLDLTGFTAEEAQALFLVAGARRGGTDEGSAGLRSALRKVHAALPEPLRAHAAAASGATVIDSARWGRPRLEAPVHLEALQRAVLAKVQVDIDYAKPGQGPERRRVHPYGLVDKGGVWYLLAGTDQGRRMFRLSRVRGVWPTDDPVEIPDSFDLAAEWESSQLEYAERMRVVEVEVDVAERAVLSLTAWLGSWTALAERPGAPAGWRRFTVAVPHVGAAAGELARFGGDVRVRSPEAVRRELARLGAALVAANA